MEAYEESGEFPPDVEFVELETDVGWYGRHARKILRDQVTSFFGPTKGCKIFILPRSKLLVLVLRNGFVNSSPFLILYFFIQITLRREIQSIPDICHFFLHGQNFWRIKFTPNFTR